MSYGLDLQQYSQSAPGQSSSAKSFLTVPKARWEEEEEELMAQQPQLASGLGGSMFATGAVGGL